MQGLSGLSACDWAKTVSLVIGGKGGGNQVSAQASGTLIGNVQEAVKMAREFATSKIA